MRKRSKTILSALTVFALFALIPMIDTKAQDNCIYAEVEKFTLGQGVLIEPRVVELQSGDNYAKIVNRIMMEEGYAYSYTGNYESGFYLGSIYGADTGEIYFPNAVTSLPPYQSGSQVYEPPSNDAFYVNEEFPNLGEFAYTNMSGWIYSVNNGMPNVSMADYPVTAGDVLRVQFTVFGYGQDLGSVNRDALIRKLAQINEESEVWFAIEGCEDAYLQAMNVLENLDATQGEVDAAAAALPEKLQYPNTLSLAETALQKMVDDEPFQLTVQILPEDANVRKVTFSSSDTEVASVDAAGWVTPVGIGKTIIEAETLNGCTAECLVEISDRPLTSISLNSSEVYLKYEPASSCQLKVISWEPENTTDARDIVWTSDHPEIAEVTDGGAVSGKSEGTAVITATAARGITAACIVHVSPSTEVIQELKSLLEALPTAENLAITDSRAVAEAEERFGQSSDTVKAAISEELQQKLADCIERMAELEGYQTAAREVERLILLLPRSDQITLSQREHTEAARLAYSQLPEQAKAMVAEAYLEKLAACEKSLKEQQVELEKLEHIIAKAEAVILDASDVKIQGFLDVISGYDEISAAVRSYCGTEKLRKIEAAENTIGEKFHSSAEVTAEIPWYVQLQAEEADEERKAAFQNSLRKGTEAERTEVGNVYRISLQDRLSNTNYDTKEMVIFKIKTPGAAKFVNPKVFAGTETATGAVAVQFASGEWNVLKTECKVNLHLQDPLWIGIAQVPITLRGIRADEDTVRLDIGESTDLVINKVPETATDELKLTYQSSNPSVAAVSSNGKITGRKEGTTTITVSCNQGYKTICKVTVSMEANGVSIHEIENAMEKTAAYMVNANTQPGLAEQWPVIGMKRSGLKNDQYFKNFYNNAAAALAEADGILTTRRYTDYAKLILSMTAIGKDARDIAGYNLFSYLADMENIKLQGNNGPIWALIALKANPDYVIPAVSGVSEQTTEEKLLKEILNQELSGGGWALSGTTAEVDMTAMAIQALAPWYQKDRAVTAAIDRGLGKLSSLQQSDGSFSYAGDANTESTVQVIVALTALGINPAEDARFIKHGHWTVEALLSFYIKGGGFSHTVGGKLNGMSTEQGYYALTAYMRLLDGKTSLYDMSDIKLTEGGAGESTTEKPTEKQTESETKSTEKKETEKKETEKKETEKKKTSGTTKKASGQSNTGNGSSTAKKKTTTAQADKNKSKKTTETEWNFQGPEFEQGSESGAVSQTVQSQNKSAGKGGYFIAAGAGIGILLLFEGLGYVIYRKKKRKEKA